MSFGKRLRDLRNNLKMTAKELSSKIGYSTNLIYDWEKGRAEPNFKTLTRIAEMFDVSTDYLLGKDNDQYMTINCSLSEYEMLRSYRQLRTSLKPLIKTQIDMICAMQSSHYPDLKNFYLDLKNQYFELSERARNIIREQCITFTELEKLFENTEKSH